jgi:TMEM175 potassium channel family protein
MQPQLSETVSKKTSRIEAFSDGVFSIAITLLVLDIHVPTVKDNESLLGMLASNWQAYLAFVIGFFTLLVCWINHHYMFELISRTNGMLLLLNGFKLLIVSFTPFATALISKYITTAQQQTAVSIYALNFFLMGTAMTCLWLYAAKHGLTKSGESHVLKAATQLYIFASVFSGTIFIVSFLSIPVSLVLFGLMFLIFVFPKNMVLLLIRKRTQVVKEKQISSISQVQQEYVNTGAS